MCVFRERAGLERGLMAYVLLADVFERRVNDEDAATNHDIVLEIRNM